jgi:hypothetical protein
MSPYPADDHEEIHIPAMEWPAGHPVAGYPRGYYDFIALFNDWQFHECHETLEAVWLDTRGPERDFYQGLIHVATAFHHIERGNMKGARLLLQSGHKLLEAYPDDFRHFPLGAWKAMCETWFPLVDQAWRRKKTVYLDAAPILFVGLIPAIVRNDAPSA